MLTSIIKCVSLFLSLLTFLHAVNRSTLNFEGVHQRSSKHHIPKMYQSTHARTSCFITGVSNLHCNAAANKVVWGLKRSRKLRSWIIKRKQTWSICFWSFLQNTVMKKSSWNLRFDQTVYPSSSLAARLLQLPNNGLPHKCISSCSSSTWSSDLDKSPKGATVL